MVCEEESPSTILLLSSNHSSSSFRELDDAFLQTQTRIWLGEVLQIRLDEQLIISELLADGELLFQVSKVMWKLLLEKHVELRHIKALKNYPFSTKRNSGIYRPYSNVDSFLKICKILGLTGIDLFTPSDVVERRNTRRVCMCIRSFSKKSRSMNINNVPDFDIVTCMVAMPKDMVGCIRRSIELSRSVLTDSSSHHLQKQARRKSCQGYSVTSSSRDYAAYSDLTNDTEIMHPFPQSYDLHADDDLYDYKSEISYNIPDLMVESEFVSGDLGELDIKNQQRNEISNDEFELLSSMESSEYHCSDSIEHEHDCKLTWQSSSCGDLNVDIIGMTSHLDTRVEQVQESRNMDYNYFEHGLFRNNASVIGIPTNDKTSVMGATSHAKNKNPDLIDEENSTPNEHQSASSQGSNPTPQSIESGRCFDVSDNMEVLQVAVMSCLTREPLNLGDLFDAEKNAEKIESFKSHNDKNDQWDKIKEYEVQDIMKWKDLVYDISSSESSYPVNEFEEIEHSLYSPDRHFCNTNSSDQAVLHSNDISLIKLENTLAYEDMESQVDSRCSDNASCNQFGEFMSCHSYYLPKFCEWDQKGKCVMASSRVKDNQSSSCFCEDGSHKEITPCKQEDSDAMMSKVMLSCMPSEEGIANAAAIKLGSDGKLNNGCLDLASNALDVVALTNCDENVSNTGCSTTNKSSKLECNDIHQECHYDKDHICHPEHTILHIKEEIKQTCSLTLLANESVHSLEYLVEAKEDSVEIPKSKPQKKLLLRSVLGGATAVGLLFMFLHIRKNGGEKVAQPSKTLSHKNKDKIQKNSIEKVNKISTTKGTYPAKNLQLK